MRFQHNNVNVYVSTGGRSHVEGQAFLFFLHGAGSSHLIWSQQSRSFAYAGYNVFAVDFPGHNLSGGQPLGTVGEQADWLKTVMDRFGIEKAVLAGHSQGGLVALEMASLYPERVDACVFIASADAIAVNDMLISTAETEEAVAKSSMTAWGLGPDAHHFGNTVPGFSHVGLGLRSMDRNPPGVVATDLKACAAYVGGLEKAAGLECATLCVLAGKDKMTPLKSGQRLAQALPDNKLYIVKNSGHSLPVEYPHELNEYLRDFLSALPAGRSS